MPASKNLNPTVRGGRQAGCCSPVVCDRMIILASLFLYLTDCFPILARVLRGGVRAEFLTDLKAT
jgi:hypothetical protein